MMMPSALYAALLYGFAVAYQLKLEQLQQLQQLQPQQHSQLSEKQLS
ncbi:hypothetical protein FHS59_003473 [Algoriphagus iocasae]|uniref:Uncharacterized protein n=1 Tax=Algoriphagus iocasae TaxID=1836499 RepID=A0A841MK79_9BACT|nr:hypothetical protein [Algoriphagus iocasae]